MVGWRNPKPPQLCRGDPSDLLTIERPWIAGRNRASEDLKRHCPIRIAEAKGHETLSDLDDDPEFLCELPAKTGLPRFAGPPFPTGKFPESS